METCNFINMEASVYVFSCELCEIFQNTHYIKHVWPVSSCNEKANTLFLVINEIFAMKKCDSSALQKDQNRLIEK